MTTTPTPQPESAASGMRERVRKHIELAIGEVVLNRPCVDSIMDKHTDAICALHLQGGAVPEGMVAVTRDFLERLRAVGGAVGFEAEKALASRPLPTVVGEK